ncbi:MAG: hypothetical protein LUC86_04525 [Prevotellaceae bacterium]|nr:hypothetical protein [Prevotellaceae bacterium]
MTHGEVIKKIYEKALATSSESEISKSLTPETKEQVRQIVDKAEDVKGVVAVLATLLTHKIVIPTQDIRYHQKKMDGGFSGRTIDTKHITPFLKSVDFPAMAESGWLTRALEQDHPYTLDYPGAIRYSKVKAAFLHIIDKVQVRKESPEAVLSYMFYLLIEQRDKKASSLPSHTNCPYPPSSACLRSTSHTNTQVMVPPDCPRLQYMRHTSV